MRYLLDIPEYHAEGFKTEAGRTRRYFKSDPPPPPDYAAAARETAAGNREAAEYAVNANRINQYTPYGSLTYTRPQRQYDQAAYDAAMARYNQQLAQPAPAPAGRPQGGMVPSGPAWQNGEYTAPAQQPGQTPTLTAPKLEDFAIEGDGSGWEQRVNLTPEAQQALDQQLALNRKYGETANAGFDRVRDLFENPQLDTSLLPDRAINVGQTAQEAIMSRLAPQLAQQEEALRARLANQGITLGSEAYGRENTIQGQRGNDLMLQAALQGISLDQANRTNALQEQAYLQDRPLNLINALRTGNQVQAPQFQQFAQQATTAGPDMLAATNAQYQADLAASNAENAGFGNIFGGLMDLGSLGVNAYKSGMFSDKRLKKNIQLVGKMDNGLNIYSYQYVWGGPTQLGVMAQEVEKVNPDAVFEVSGYKAVDYSKL